MPPHNLSSIFMDPLVSRIDVHARLLILGTKSPLHGLIWVCKFIDFEKKIHPARLFGPQFICDQLQNKVIQVKNCLQFC